MKLIVLSVLVAVACGVMYTFVFYSLKTSI